jgi:hypothetical protein
VESFDIWGKISKNYPLVPLSYFFQLFLRASLNLEKLMI